MSDQSLIREAVTLALTHSTGGENGPFGSVIARDGEIVGRGWNRVVETCDPTAHAEVVAIRDAARRLGTHVLDGCTIYCSCEPCPMCLSAIYWARIGRVVYASTQEEARAAGFDDSRIHSEVTAAWPDRAVTSVHLPVPEAMDVLRRWRENPNRVDY
jgi:tRNA(Arg) A34 adenosine deaminase TadA